MRERISLEARGGYSDRPHEVSVLYSVFKEHRAEDGSMTRAGRLVGLRRAEPSRPEGWLPHL